MPHQTSKQKINKTPSVCSIVLLIVPAIVLAVIGFSISNYYFVSSYVTKPEYGPLVFVGFSGFIVCGLIGYFIVKQPRRNGFSTEQQALKASLPYLLMPAFSLCLSLLGTHALLHYFMIQATGEAENEAQQIHKQMSLQQIHTQNISATYITHSKKQPLPNAYQDIQVIWRMKQWPYAIIICKGNPVCCEKSSFSSSSPLFNWLPKSSS